MKMTKSAEDKILDFFKTHSGQVWDSGDLQRMTFTNKNGTLAKPKSISRRLQELCEENKIVNVGDAKSAKYSLNVEVVKPKMRQVITRLDDDTVRVEYVPV